MNEKEPDNMVNNRKFQRILTIVLGIGLAYFYGRNVFSLHTVWELGDEAGYLWNAAYFTGTDWKSFAAAYSYYGYGYSIILTPLFWITGNGIQLIQGAYIINILCVIGMYFIIIKLLEEMGNKAGSTNIPVISFVACMMPYIASNTLKVLCEVFLTFWYCLLLLLLYYLLKKQKKKYAVLLGICSAFIFFIHTRAIVVIGTMVLALFFSAIRKKREYVKVFIIFLTVTSVLFIPLYLIKLNIIDYKNIFRQLEQVTTKDANIIDSNYILERFKWFNPRNYLASFMTKMFYSIYATGGIILPGFVCMMKQTYAAFKSQKDISDKDYATSIIKLYVMVTFVLMVIACTMSGTGNDIRYAAYGRYYEYTIPIILSFSIYFFFNEKIKEKEMFICIVSLVCIGIWARNWCTSYLADQAISVDTNRIAAFAKVASVNDDLGDAMWYILLISIALMVCYTVVYKKKYGRWIVMLLISVTLWVNTYSCINKIHELQDKHKGDTEVAEYLLENLNLQKVYMIDDNSYWYPYFYSRMQILLKDTPIDVINPDENETIESGSYVLVYSTTKLKDSLLSDYSFIMNGKVFVLYQK